MKKRVVAVMLIAVMTTLLAVGCGEKNSNQKEENSTKTEDTQKELEKITVTEPVRGILWAPVYAAKELGYFEEEGLDVDITAIKSDTPSAPVMAGEAQIGLWGPEMVCKLVQDGQDIQLFYTCTDKYPYSFFLAKDIKSVADLKGTAVNAARSGGSPRAYVRSILRNAGLNADGDVTYVNMDNSAVLAALESGEIKATYASPELRAQLIDAGYEPPIDIYKPEVHKEIIGSETYEMYICYAKKSYIDENPETIQHFVNACYKAAQYLDKSSVDDIVKTLQEPFKEMSNLEQIVKECKDNEIWSPDGLFTDDGVKAINNMAIEAGLITEPVDRSALINETFVKKAAGQK